MKKIIVFLLCLTLCFSAGCKKNGKDNDDANYYPTKILEVGAQYDLSSFSEIQSVKNSSGEAVSCQGKIFNAEKEGDYVVEFADGSFMFIKVYPSEAPKMKFLENTDALLWKDGQKIYLPDPMVSDNVDDKIELSFKAWKENSPENLIPCDNGELQVQTETGEWYNVEYCAKDAVGNETKKVLKVYATGKYEIANFETSALVGIGQPDDGNVSNSQIHLLYNEDAKFVKDGAGSLKVAIDPYGNYTNSWPGVKYLTSKLSYRNFNGEGENPTGFYFDFYMPDIGIESPAGQGGNCEVMVSVYSRKEGVTTGSSTIIFTDASETDNWAHIEYDTWNRLEITSDMIKNNIENGTVDIADIDEIKIWVKAFSQEQSEQCGAAQKVFYIDNFNYMK